MLSNFSSVVDFFLLQISPVHFALASQFHIRYFLKINYLYLPLHRKITASYQHLSKRLHVIQRRNLPDKLILSNTEDSRSPDSKQAAIVCQAINVVYWFVVKMFSM